MKIKEFRPFEKGFLKGFATIVLDKFAGLEINSVSVFDKNGVRWMSFPSRQYESEGKKMYAGYLKFPDSGVMKRFQDDFFKELDAWIKANPVQPQGNQATQQGSQQAPPYNEELPF